MTALVLAVGGILGAGPGQGTLAELRVRSEANETVIEARIGRDVGVEDQTRGARATGPETEVRPEDSIAEEGRKPGRPGTPPLKHRPQLVSANTTFAEEIRIRLRNLRAPRSASIIVGDSLVSEVRILSHTPGIVVVVFVRQPVRYEVWRVAGGEALRIEIRPGRLVAPGRGDRAVISGRGDEREVTVDAERVRYDRQKNVILASGGVVVKRPGTVLTADEVRVNRSTYDGEAVGRVVLRTEGTVVRGDYVHLNLADETGWIDGGEVDFPGPKAEYVMRGDRIRKGFGQTYSVESGVLTTCRCGGLEAPSWSIAARRLDVDVLGRGTARHLTLRVRDVPVFYWPLGIFPVNSTRQSGFLTPRVGISESRGFKYEQPFYWAINRSSDATVAFDIETSARMGGVGEYRYALDRRSEGILAAAYFNETLRSKSDLKRVRQDYAENNIFEPPADERWAVFTEMEQSFPGGVRAYADTMLVSQDLFFTEIDSTSFKPARGAAARTRFYTASRVGLLKTWQGAYLWGESAFFQDLDVTREKEDEEVLQRLPGIEFRAQRAVINDRLVLSFAGEAVDYQRRVGFDGLRLDLQPEVRMPFRIGRAVFGSLEASARETVYHLTDTAELRRRSSTRELFQVGWKLGTEVARVYPFRRWGFDGLKHTIEPTVSYLFVPPIGGQEELPLFDGVDRINNRSLFSYGLVSRLKARLDAGTSGDDESSPVAPLVREVARVSLLQVYDTKRKIAGSEHVSDLDLELRMNPSNLLALHYGATYNAQQRELKGTSISLSVREPWRTSDQRLALLQMPSKLSLSYRFVGGGVGAEESVGQKELGGALYMRIGRFFGLFFQGRLNLLAEEQGLEGGVMREAGIGARLISRCRCWMLEMGVDDRADTEETLVRAQLTLSGIGSLGAAPGQRLLSGRSVGLGRHWR